MYDPSSRCPVGFVSPIMVGNVYGVWYRRGRTYNCAFPVYVHSLTIFFVAIGLNGCVRSLDREESLTEENVTYRKSNREFLFGPDFIFSLPGMKTGAAGLGRMYGRFPALLGLELSRRSQKLTVRLKSMLVTRTSRLLRQKRSGGGNVSDSVSGESTCGRRVFMT